VCDAVAGRGVQGVCGVRADEEWVEDVGWSESFGAALRADVVACAGYAEKVVGEGEIETGEKCHFVSEVFGVLEDPEVSWA
jgi:hypothetical protein